MAFNNGFPMNYSQMYYPQYQQPQQMQQATQIQAQYPATQGGFVRVRSENEARMYPVAPGNSVTFIDETGPYCYCKTVNMGQLDRPIFEKYRLVKEEDATQPVEARDKPVEAQAVDLSNFIIKQDFDAVKRDIDAIKQDIESFRGDLYGLAGKKTTSRKKEVTPDE